MFNDDIQVRGPLLAGKLIDGLLSCIYRLRAPLGRPSLVSMEPSGSKISL